MQAQVFLCRAAKGPGQLAWPHKASCELSDCGFPVGKRERSHIHTSGPATASRALRKRCAGAAEDRKRSVPQLHTHRRPLETIGAVRRPGTRHARPRSLRGRRWRRCPL